MSAFPAWEESTVFMQIIDSLAPVVLLIGLGAFLVRIGFLKRELLKGMNDLAYWIGLPTFIFYSLATVRPDLTSLGPMLTVFLSGTAAALGAGFVAVHLLKEPIASRGTFLQATFRGNLAFIGLPIVIFTASGLPEGDPEKMQELAVLTLAPMMVVYNVVAVLLLYGSQTGFSGKLISKTIRQVATNPLILASIAGIAFALSGWTFPNFLDRSLEALGRLALPLALLSIGGSLLTVPVRGSFAAAGTASLCKVGVAPLAGIGVGIVLNAPSEVLLVAAIYLSCPTAAASYVLARQLGGDEALAAGTIVISTILSIVSLSLAVAFIGSTVSF